MICLSCFVERAFRLPCFDCGAPVQELSPAEDAHEEIRRSRDAQWDRAYRMLTGQETPEDKKPASPFQYLYPKASVRCRRCGEGSRRLVCEKVVELYDHHRTVTRDVKQYDSTGFRVIWRIERRVQVTIRTVVIEETYSCKKCGHRWSGQREETREIEAKHARMQTSLV